MFKWRGQLIFLLRDMRQQQDRQVRRGTEWIIYFDKRGRVNPTGLSMGDTPSHHAQGARPRTKGPIVIRPCIFIQLTCAWTYSYTLDSDQIDLWLWLCSNYSSQVRLSWYSKAGLEYRLRPSLVKALRSKLVCIVGKHALCTTRQASCCCCWSKRVNGRTEMVREKCLREQTQTLLRHNFDTWSW